MGDYSYLPGENNLASSIALAVLNDPKVRGILVGFFAEAIARSMPQPQSAPGLRRTPEMAEELGVSVATFNRTVLEGMPFVVVGKTRRFDPEAVRAWLASRSVERGNAQSPNIPKPAQTSLAGVRRLSRGSK